MAFGGGSEVTKKQSNTITSAPTKSQNAAGGGASDNLKAIQDSMAALG